MLTYDRLVDTEKRDGAGSNEIGGGRCARPAVFCASCCARYFSYSVNERLLRVDGVFRKPLPTSFEDLDVIPVEVVPFEAEEAVLA